MSLKLRWLGTACFEIVMPNNQTVVIDPYVDDSVSAPIRSEQFNACHYIFITHGHYDHILDVGKLAKRFTPEIFCSDVTARSLIQVQGVDPGLITQITRDDQIEREGLKVAVLEGRHVDFASEYRRLTGHGLPANASGSMTTVREALKVMLGTDQVPEQFEDWMATYPGGEQLNFVFQPSGGERVYMAGSYPHPDIIAAAESAKAFLTLLQVLPGNTVRGMEEMIFRLAVASGCKIAVPQHHDPLFRGSKETDLSELKRIMAKKSNIMFQELVPGTWYGLTEDKLKPISLDEKAS
ncbi:MAG: MBL fold metallo-hydrolase [Deltaproteobacteria bacterium]|nr:MBL fold metallo-hydrolase [Deltaproteobacteria bacterium]